MSVPTKTLIATRLFTPEVGAAAFRLQALADGLVEDGLDVEVLSTTPPRSAGPCRDSVRVRRWPVLRDAGGNVRGYVQYLSFDVPLFFRLLLSRADVVVSEPPPTTGLVVAVSSLLRRRPFVYYAADIWSDALQAMNVGGPVHKVLRGIEGFVLRRARAVIAVSDGVADQVASFGVPRDRIHSVGNGIDMSTFVPDGPVADQNAKPYFVYTGTMSEWQDAGIFIKALSQLPANVELRFFGQGSDEEALKALAEREAPGRVHFGGVIPAEEAARWIRGAAAAVVSIKPGQGYDFAKPTKIYAAAACGTPVLYAGTGDAAELVSDGGLGAASDFTPDAVASAMRAVLDDPSFGGTQSRDGRVDWVRENASLAAAGRRAAAVVRTAAHGAG